jgi:DNA-binding transcriptional regulator YdaS (Cro superfamily)
MTPLERAVIAAGGPASLARQLCIKRQAVHKWTRVPADQVIAVERITGISRHELRPDVFGDGIGWAHRRKNAGPRK